MPHKGFYTQGLAILLRNAVPLDAIEARLGDFDIVKRTQASAHWTPRRADADGGVPTRCQRICRDRYLRPALARQHGRSEGRARDLCRWSMGHFGPGAWPGSLERACRYSWAWPDGRTVPLQHQAFIRIRTSYIFGAPDDAVVMPEDCDAVHELQFVTRLAAALVRLPEALCFFDPNGECVRGVPELLAALDEHASAKRPPLDVWSNVRFFTFRDVDPAWSLMDTVGMGQLDAPDQEAIFQLGV